MALTGAVTAAVAVLVAAPPARAGQAPAAAASARPGWTSGAYLGTLSPSAVADFGRWRGRPVDVVVTYTGRDSWSDLVTPTWVYAAMASTSYDVSLSVPPFPGDGTSTLQRCAAGDYHDRWLDFGRAAARAGVAGRLIVRLGWEFNGDWNPWSANDPQTFAACWRQIVTAARVYAPALRWDWSVNRGPGQSVRDARDAWPGDDYVDIVGVDSYDWWPAATASAAWQEQVDGPFGLSFWLGFAVQHGKRFSVPEWGLIPASPHSGGDNADYIRAMQWFFARAAPYLAYEAYFNDDAGTRGALWEPDQNPRAAAAYRAGLTNP